MWFLYFYLISTIICFVVIEIMSKAVSNRIKREYPNIKYEKKTKVELLSASLPLLIPFINIILICFNIFQQDKIYKEVVNKLQNQQKEEE